MGGSYILADWWSPLPVGPGMPDIDTSILRRGSNYWKRRMASSVVDPLAHNAKLVNNLLCQEIPYLARSKEIMIENNERIIN